MGQQPTGINTSRRAAVKLVWISGGSFFFRLWLRCADILPLYQKSRAAPFSLWGTSCVYFGALIFLAHLGVDVEKKATRLPHKCKQTAAKVFFTGWLDAKQRVSTRCIISMRQIAAFSSRSVLILGLCDGLNLWTPKKKKTLFDQRERVVSLPSPVAWNHFLQGKQQLQHFQSTFISIYQSVKGCFFLQLRGWIFNV